MSVSRGGGREQSLSTFTRCGGPSTRKRYDKWPAKDISVNTH